jgi:hypothetical protein
MQLFRGDERLPRDYLRLEQRYLQFADAIRADPSQLDLVIWKTMKRSTRLVMTILKQPLLTHASCGDKAIVMKEAA